MICANALDGKPDGALPDQTAVKPRTRRGSLNQLLQANWKLIEESPEAPVYRP